MKKLFKLKTVFLLFIFFLIPTLHKNFIKEKTSYFAEKILMSHRRHFSGSFYNKTSINVNNINEKILEINEKVFEIQNEMLLSSIEFQRKIALANKEISLSLEKTARLQESSIENFAIFFYSIIIIVIFGIVFVCLYIYFDNNRYTEKRAEERIKVDRNEFFNFNDLFFFNNERNENINGEDENPAPIVLTNNGDENNKVDESVEEYPSEEELYNKK